MNIIINLIYFFLKIRGDNFLKSRTSLTLGGKGYKIDKVR
jgi:hypothetical protein